MSHANAFEPAAAWYVRFYPCFIIALAERNNETQKKMKYRVSAVKRHTKRPCAMILTIAHGQFAWLMLKLWYKHGRNMARQCSARHLRRSARTRKQRHVTC